VNLTAAELTHLLEVIFPGIILCSLVGGIVFRLTVKPTIDAILRLRDGVRSDQDQTLARLVRLEEAVARLGTAQGPVAQGLEESWVRDRAPQRFSR
jgi:hypothetical protein